MTPPSRTIATPPHSNGEEGYSAACAFAAGEIAFMVPP